MISVALHGLGRFGQHWLYAWLQRPQQIQLCGLADPLLSAQALCRLLEQHDRLDFASAQPRANEGYLHLTDCNGQRHVVPFYQGKAEHIPWLGLAELWLECSGVYSTAAACQAVRVGNTKQVLLAASCRDADATLVMGYNQQQWSSDHRVISYGSCTVNAFVPLAAWLQQTYGVEQAQVTILHNRPAYQLSAHPEPERRACTLEWMAPQLLPWLSPEQLDVSYTLIPYSGASLVELRFDLACVLDRAELIEQLQLACEQGVLATRYRLEAEDPGLTAVLGQPLNLLLYQTGIQLRRNRLKVLAYLDNENSATRYFELLEWIALQWQQLATTSTK